MSMKLNETFTTYGHFNLTPERQIHGELKVSGTESYLLLNNRDSLGYGYEKNNHIKGILHDLTKVTLIDCITTGSETITRNEVKSHFLRLFPHFVITGDKHLSHQERVIRELSIFIEDASVLFYDFDAFSTVIDGRPYIRQVVDANKLDRVIEIGEDPIIAYFTGKYEIFKTNSVLGNISVEHHPSFSMGGPDGVRIDNSISVNITPNQSINFYEAFDYVLKLLRFFEIVIGRKQKLNKFLLFVGDEEKLSKPFRVYSSISPGRKDESSEKEDRSPHPSDVLTNPIFYPHEFEKVLTKWLESDSLRMDARCRFSNSFCQNKYSIDRLICAANMFDILPDSAIPKNIELSDELQEAKKKCRDIFKSLPHSYERERILIELKKLGECVLKHKVRHRASFIIDAVGERFPNLILVLDEAVNCRNHYVHGAKTKIDYSHNSDLLIFFTNTLEFVFATADLIESGWNIRSWCERGTTMSHPFGSYLINYKYNLAILENCFSNKTSK